MKQVKTELRTKMEEYKRLIDDDIATYSKHVRQTTLQQYGKYARLESDAFLELLNRGGKRLRGILTMIGYEMSGGKDKAMILQAARAVEMLHAYILIIDDIQDLSDYRRGGESVHAYFERYHHEQQLSGDAKHFGVSLALNAALAGAHAAQAILANLNADAELRMKVVSIFNRTMQVTAHGQTGDIMNEVSPNTTRADIENVLNWKSAQYTFLNPLHVGMVLADADCHATDAITNYATNTGIAFQIRDDIISSFGDQSETGKNPMDDIREGKRTLLTFYALEHANDTDRNFLIQMLGNAHLTKVQFERCKEIIVQTGALDHVQEQAKKLIKDAQESLNKEAARWSHTEVLLLRDLANYLLI